jgi:WhiB family transcriptional regulator, redox-sensing transcriptional regulator
MTILDFLTIPGQLQPPGVRLLPCQREDPRLWFSERPADLEQAKAFCQSCPVRAPCLAGATERQEPHGVWGGEIFEQGSVIAMKRPRGRPPKKTGPPVCVADERSGAA